MKRILNFIFGLWIFLTVGVLFIHFLNLGPTQPYLEQAQEYKWFFPVLYWLAGLLLGIAFLIMIWSFRPSHKSRGLLLSYSDGEIFINKKSIEKTILHTVRKYDGLFQPDIKVNLFQKKKKSFIDVNVDVLASQTDQLPSTLNSLKEEIKSVTENFAELPVREVKINLLDQKSLNKRVL